MQRRPIVEALDMRRVDRFHILVPGALEGLHGGFASCLHGGEILGLIARRELCERAVREVALALQEQRLVPDFPVAVEQPLLLGHCGIARDFLAVDACPQFAQLDR
jgi:hypothetical protein